MISNPGQTCLSRIYSLLPRSVKRRLNPHFVDWLMGLLPGWTSCDPLVMESFRLWQHTHTARLIEIIETTSTISQQLLHRRDFVHRYGFRIGPILVLSCSRERLSHRLHLVDHLSLRLSESQAENTPNPEDSPDR